MFNSGWAAAETMAAMHQTAERLYSIAKAMRGISLPSALAEALDESHQVVTNWGRRGISIAGALKAQQVFGCNANWLLSGEGSVLAGWPFSGELLAAVRKLNPQQLLKCENVLRVHLDLEMLDALPPLEVESGSEVNSEDLQAFARAHEAANVKGRQKPRAA